MKITAALGLEYGPYNPTVVRSKLKWHGRAVAGRSSRGRPPLHHRAKGRPLLESFVANFSTLSFFGATEQQTEGQTAHMFRYGMMECGQLWLA